MTVCSPHEAAPRGSVDDMSEMTASTIPAMESAFRAIRQASRGELSVPAATRKDRLRRLLALLTGQASEFEAAISADFGHRCAQETRLLESFVVGAGIKHALRHLDDWMRPQRMATQLPFLPGTNRLMPQPLGIVGIIAPWNYPLQLTLAPMTGALAAGNRIMLKPSELTPHFSDALAAAIARHFDATEAVVMTGAADVAAAFASLPFDHLLFTGSGRVGRLVSEAAARNLTPITLELGGKSPAIIDRSADLTQAARRIAVGKLLNAGQTCIAPDYVLCPCESVARFVELFFASAETLYGSDPDNPDYTAIINAARYERLEALLADATARGGKVERRAGHLAQWRAVRKFPPSLVLSPSDHMLVSREEIFGPILPVFAYDSADDAIAFVNARERPLALYWFGTDVTARDQILRETVSGGVTINDCLLHLAQESQPFGGVGASGTGAYHGEWGFRTFSKQKPVFLRRRLSMTGLTRPPYRKAFDRVLAALHWLT
jgi:coniferyl-aldehyde dehydrogenase